MVFQENINHPIFFPTWEERIFNKNGGAILGFKQIKGNLYGNIHTLAVNSDKYQYISNVDVANGVKEGLQKVVGDQFSYSPELSAAVGNRYFMTFDLDMSFDDGKSENGIQVLAINGFKFTAIKIILGILRFFCTNQIVSMERGGEKIVKNHSGRLDISEIAGKVGELLEYSVKFREKILALKEVKAEKEFVNLVYEIDKISPKAAENFINIFENVKTTSVYDIYNMLTYFISHAIGARHYRYFQYQALANQLINGKLK